MPRAVAIAGAGAKREERDRWRLASAAGDVPIAGDGGDNGERLGH